MHHLVSSISKIAIKTGNKTSKSAYFIFLYPAKTLADDLLMRKQNIIIRSI